MEELRSSANSQGVASADPAISKLWGELVVKFDGDLQAELGAEGYKSYVQFKRALPALEMVDTLAARTYRSEAPLTSQQGEQLAQVVVEQTRAVPIAQGSRTVRFETDWAVVGAEAQKILAPGQTAVFQALLDGKVRQAKMSALSSAARASSSSKGSSAGGAAKPGS